MIDTAFIDKVVVNLSGADPKERAELWADAVRPLFDVSLLDGAPEAQVGRANGWLLDTLLLTDAQFGDQLIHRHKTHFAAAAADLVLVEIYRAGETHGDLAGEPVHIRPGDIHMVDFSREYRARSTPTDALGLVVSHEVLGYDPRRHPPVIRIPGDGVTGRVLRHAIAGIYENLDQTTKAESATLARGLVALLRTVLFSDAELAQSAPSFTKARSRLIRDHIQQNLQSPDLTVDRICARFNISRATLYRDFKAEGGLERHILGSRLEAALMALAFGAQERGSVTRVAEQLGFPSTSYFSREFKRHFGFGPSSVVGQNRRPHGKDGVQKANRIDSIDRLLDQL